MSNNNGKIFNIEYGQNSKITVTLYEGEQMKISELSIKDIGGIKNLDLEFNDHLNVICGTNGIGKTTIINSIAVAFSNYSESLKRNANAEKGEVQATIDGETHSFITNIIEPNSSITSASKAGKDLSKMIYIGSERDILYTSITKPSDPSMRQHELQSSLQKPLNTQELKRWFVMRSLSNTANSDISLAMLNNNTMAKKVLTLIDNNFEFDKVNSKTFDIMVNTPSGKIYYEFLSSGFKSCIYTLLGILNQIEIKNPNKDYISIEFDGIILIDELESHLHPEWQSKMIEILKYMFPKAQIIVTTHSPHILQVLELNEIIALEETSPGNLRKKELSLGKYGLQGWTIEEILEDIMGMKTTRSKLYTDTMSAFTTALDLEDVEKIKANHKILKELLSKKNPLRTIIDIQAAEFLDSSDMED